MGLIEFIPCGGKLCAVHVAEDGRCGPRVMELARDTLPQAMGLQQFRGSMKWGESPLEIFGQIGDRGLSLNATPPGRSLASRRSMPVYSGLFVKLGPGQCAGPVS